MGRFTHALRTIGRAVDEVETLAPSAVRAKSSRRLGMLAPLLGRGASSTADGTADLPELETASLESSTSAFGIPEEDAAVVDLPSVETLPEVSDGRLFNPEGDAQPARRTTGVAVRRRKVGRTTQLAVYPSNAIAFPVPASVDVCVRRSLRRKAILANGKGGGSHKPPVRNSNSEVHCERI